MKLTKKQKAENEERAQRARNAIDAYSVEVGSKEDYNLCDLLTDLMHRSAIDCEAEDFEQALEKARMHFNTETTEEQQA